METAKVIRFVAWPLIILLQFISAQIVTFLFSLIFGGMETLILEEPVMIAVFVGATYSIGIFLVGAMAIRMHWLDLIPKDWFRFTGTLVGVYLFLILGLVVYRGVAVDNPFFIFVSPLAGVLGFYLGGWAKKN